VLTTLLISTQSSTLWLKPSFVMCPGLKLARMIVVLPVSAVVVLANVLLTARLNPLIVGSLSARLM
jgi:hypothetical protein